MKDSRVDEALGLGPRKQQQQNNNAKNKTVK